MLTIIISVIAFMIDPMLGWPVFIALIIFQVLSRD